MIQDPPGKKFVCGLMFRYTITKQLLKLYCTAYFIISIRHTRQRIKSRTLCVGVYIDIPQNVPLICFSLTIIMLYNIYASYSVELL